MPEGKVFARLPRAPKQHPQYRVDQIIEHAGRQYVGGTCERFGCAHIFLEHDFGTPSSGGQCRGTVLRMSEPDRPCECPSYLPSGFQGTHGEACVP